jgi:hypothetical protein
MRALTIPGALGCDDDKARFEAKLAKAKTKAVK